MSIPNNDHVAHLINTLEGLSHRFSHYQVLPPDVSKLLPNEIAGKYKSLQLSWDCKRYNWLSNCLKDSVPCGSAREIGANLGYFSLRLAQEHIRLIQMYEPISEYSAAIKIMAQILGVMEHVQVHTRNVTRADISSLPAADLSICLNVLHHAGVFFDVEDVQDEGWEAYCRIFLSDLAKQSRYLFFQTGNFRDDTTLFRTEDSIPFLGNLLAASGWQVLSCGVVMDYDNFYYSRFNADALESVPVTSCYRDPETNKVIYQRDDEIIAKLPKGNLQRPLWFCKRAE